jgi:hypothetical protein
MLAFAFWPFQLDTIAYRLTRDGVVVDASPRQLDLLAYFASRPDQLVTPDELFQTLWPDVTVMTCPQWLVPFIMRELSVSGPLNQCMFPVASLETTNARA